MANVPRRSHAASNAAVNAMAALANSGKLRIYSSTQPATGSAAFNSAGANDQVLLAELSMAATAFGTGSNGVATAGTITADSSANATGTAAWFRIVGTGGTDVTDNVYDGTVGTSGCDINLNTTSIVSGASVSVTALTLTETE